MNGVVTFIFIYTFGAREREVSSDSWIKLGPTGGEAHVRHASRTLLDEDQRQQPVTSSKSCTREVSPTEVVDAGPQGRTKMRVGSTNKRIERIKKN